MSNRIYIIVEQIGVLLIAAHAISWSVHNNIEDAFGMRIVIINYMIVVVLLLLAASIYFSNKWDDRKWKRTIINSQIVLYSLYYIFYCWIILESRKTFLKEYILQTFFISTNLWNHLNCLKYRYIILLAFQLVFISISLAVSKIQEDIWNYIIVASAFLLLLYSIEFNGQLKQKLLQQSLLYLQQEFNAISNQQIALNLKSDRIIEELPKSQKQFQCRIPTENKLLNYQEKTQQNQQKLETVPLYTNSKNLNSPSFMSKLLTHRKGSDINTNDNNTKNENTITNLCQFSPRHQNIQSNTIEIGTNFSSKENIFKFQKAIFSNLNNQSPINSNQEEDKIILNNLLNIKYIQNFEQEGYAPTKHTPDKSDENHIQNSKRVSFSDLQFNYRGKSEFHDSTPQSSHTKRETLNRFRDNSEGNHSIDSTKINNMILKRMQSQEEIKQIVSQNKLQSQDNEMIIENTNRTSQQQSSMPLKNCIPSNQNNISDSKGGLAQYQSKPIKSFNTYNSRVNGNSQVKQDQSNCNISNNQIPPPPQIEQSFSKLKNENTDHQNQAENPNSNKQHTENTKADERQQNLKNSHSSNYKSQKGQLRHSKSDEIFFENTQQLKDKQNQEVDCNMNQKVKFNDQFSNLQKNFQQSKTQIQQTISSRSSILSNANYNSMSIRLKLHELEKNSAPANDSFNSNQLVKIQKCAYCHQQMSPSKSIIGSQALINPDDAVQNKRNSMLQNKEQRGSILLKDQMIEEYRRSLYEKMVYDTLDSGIIVLNENISIIHKNKQIHQFFHQSEVNENLMSYLKLVTISDQSIIALKQILLSSSRLERYKNERKQVNMQTMWSLTQINSFLNRLNNQSLREEPINLKEFLQSLFQIFNQKQIKFQLKDLIVEVFQVLFTSQNSDQIKQNNSQINPMYMSVQFKIFFLYRAEIDQYECLLSLVNTRQHDIAIKKEISESLSHRIFQTLSHEFGTYMNIISNITENALEDDKISIELKKDYFRIINTNSILLENVIKDMRDFFSIMNSKLEVKWSEINLRETLFQTLELFKKQFQLKKLKTQIKIQKGIQIGVNSDGQFIKQILSNFISNSLKFTLSGQIKVFLFKHSNRYLRLEVEDSGIGMSSEECERLQGMLKNGFSDEKISKNSVGLGFGLLISNNLARMIGNPQKKQAIYFQSRPQEGSKFWILINLAADQQKPSIIEQTQSKKRSIFSKQVSEVTSHKYISQMNGVIQSKEIESQIKKDYIKLDLKRQKSKSLQHQKSESDVRFKNRSECKRLDKTAHHDHDEDSSYSSDDNVKGNLQQAHLNKQNKQNSNKGLTSQDINPINNNIKQQPNLTVITNKILDKYMQYGEIISESSNSCVNKNASSSLNTDPPSKKQKQLQTSKIFDQCQSQSTYLQNNELGQYMLKLVKNTSEKHIQKDQRKRSSDNFQISSLNSYSSPLKTSHTGLVQRKKDSQTPRLSMESSQMISSKIFQIKSRAKHTITNKFSSNQLQQSFGKNELGYTDTPLNNSDHSIDITANKTQLQISKIPISTFETPNYLTMNGKKVMGQTPKSIILQQQHSFHGSNALSIASCSPLKLPNKSKETLLFYGSNQHSTIFGNNQFSISGHNQKIPTLNSIRGGSHENEQQQHKMQSNNLLDQEHRCSIEKHSNTINQYPNKHSLIFSNNCINQNQNTKNFINQRIVEEILEDDTKLNQSQQFSSEDYSSCMNENFSNNSITLKSIPSHAQVRPKKSKGSVVVQGDKTQSNNNLHHKSKNQDSQQVELSRSNSTKRNNEDESDNSLLMSTNNSISIEYIAQRDEMEFSDYEFDENLSLDDLDMVNNKHTKIQNYQQSQSQCSPLKVIKSNEGQKNNQLTNINININNNNGIKSNKNIDKWFEDTNYTSTKTVNEFRGQHFSPTKIYKGNKAVDDILQLKADGQTNNENDEDNNNKVTIPSERQIQQIDHLQDTGLPQTFGSKEKSIDFERKGLINILRVQNSDSISSDKVAEFPQQVINDIVHRTSICVQRIPSIAFNIKNQKYNTQSTIQEQNVFSFGGDDKMFFNDNYQTQQFFKNQSFQLAEVRNKRKSSSSKAGTYLQNPVHSLFLQNSPKSSQQSNNPQDEEQHEQQQQYKILCLDENNLDITNKQQLNKQQSQNNLYQNSLQTISMLNVDEHELNSPSKQNKDQIIVNNHLQNMQEQKKILLVDDEIFNIYSLKLIFSKFGLKDHILEAYNGQQAIEIIMNQQNLKSKRNNELGYQIGLIIMDVNMPIMNGIECTKYIRDQENNQTLHYSPNIIGYTAYSDSQTRESCYNAGMDDILLKPSRRDDFISVLEKYYLNS